MRCFGRLALILPFKIHLNCFLQASRSVLGGSWGVLGRLGPSWGRLGGVLRPSLGRLGTSWGRLGVVLGRPGGVLGTSWGHLGGVLESSWSVWAGSWGRSESFLGRLVNVLEATWSVFAAKFSHAILDAIFERTFVHSCLRKSNSEV